MRRWHFMGGQWQTTPQDATARNNYGSMLAKHDRLESAGIEFKAALLIDPNHAGARLNIARYYFRN